MGALKPLFDSNVLIRALNDPRALSSTPLLQDWQDLPISIVTWIEVMAGANAGNEQRTRVFLDRFTVYDITADVAEIAVGLRKTRRLKLPDALIYATALAAGRTLVTYNTRDFPEGTESVLIPS